MPIRTSETHPLQIAAVKVPAYSGRIGITFCPGKQIDSISGFTWQRDLAADLDALAHWGASTVVTLIEDHEFGMMQVEALGEGVRHRHMDWLHLPIVDVSIPDAGFEALWENVSEGLRAKLRSGAHIVVHCRGGLGRAGTIAARLLIELGMDPRDAVNQVRNVRPGAIETKSQEIYALNVWPGSEFAPPIDPISVKDRAIGALLGLAVGDAVGTSTRMAG